MNFFIRCIILMLVFTVGPWVFYLALGLILTLISYLSEQGKK